jgi:hypothetical protein
LVAAWIERYPIANFPGFWTRFEETIESGDAVASFEVLRDLKKRDDGLYKWCKARDKLFVEIDDACQDQVTDIMAKYPRFVDTRTGKNTSDPFVIALALTHTPGLMVISEEDGGAANRPAIPYVCAAEGIEHAKLLTLIQRYGWRF